MSDAPTVTVEFVDAETGQTIGRSEMPATTLPPSFAPRTTVDFDDAAWQVEGADPVSSEEYLARRHLVLTVRRLGAINSEQIRYSLPTICDPLPPMLPNAPSGELLELHEDDWRQVELISGTQANAVMADFEAIKRIYDGHGISGPDGILRGFGSIHLRERITEPLSPRCPAASCAGCSPTSSTSTGASGSGTRPAASPARSRWASARSPCTASPTTRP
ncbi:hypothetical protein ACFQX7_15450 [Luedemannella flava]